MFFSMFFIHLHRGDGIIFQKYCIVLRPHCGTVRHGTTGIPTVYCHSGTYWPSRYFGMLLRIGCIVTGFNWNLFHPFMQVDDDRAHFLVILYFIHAARTRDLGSYLWIFGNATRLLRLRFNMVSTKVNASLCFSFSRSHVFHNR